MNNVQQNNSFNLWRLKLAIVNRTSSSYRATSMLYVTQTLSVLWNNNIYIYIIYRMVSTCQVYFFNRAVCIINLYSIIATSILLHAQA